MTPRTIKALRLPVLLLMLASFISLQPRPAAGAGCNLTCWEQTCHTRYDECRADGGTSAACCRIGNECGTLCGTNCPRFC